MKVAPALAAALVLCIAIPGSNQGKGKKPKFCTGEDGNRYKRGKGYEDKEACIRYTCVYIKKGNKLKMKETKIQCTVDGAWSSWSSYSACSATCGPATKSRTRICSDPAPANGGKPCPGLSQQTTDCQLSPCGESEPGLAANVTAIENKLEALQSSVESILGMITTMQSTSSKLETCLGDVNSTDCPSSEDGKISVVDAIKGNKEDIEACEACEKPKFNLVLTGGEKSGGGDMATSEIISPGGVCSQSIPHLPVAVRGPRSVYFNNTLMVCGGAGAAPQKKCHQLRGSNSQWTEGPAMNTPRYYFSITKVEQDLYALGGLNGVHLDSMEKISESSGEWTLMAQKLTSPRRHHCTVFMEKTRSLVIIGGYPSTNLVEEFGLATSSWEELTPLPATLYGHACVVLDQSIVVTGGYSGAGNVFQKKVYTFAGGDWEMTGELQVARYYHSMGTLDNSLLVLGGRNDAGYLDTIEEMKPDGSFQIMEWKLNEKSELYAITQIPRQMFPCL